jgi:hypothetical protein
LAYEELVDQYGDVRLGTDPRNILGAMVALVRAAERPRCRDEHKLLMTLRRLNEVTDGGFFCPTCYETRFERLRVNLVITHHATAVSCTATVLTVEPGGCHHPEVTIHCGTCEHDWSPNHAVATSTSAFDPQDHDPSDPSPKKKNTEPN